MSKKNFKHTKLSEAELMDLYDKLATQFARRVESQQGNAS